MPKEKRCASLYLKAATDFLLRNKQLTPCEQTYIFERRQKNETYTAITYKKPSCTGHSEAVKGDDGGEEAVYRKASAAL